MELRKDIEQRMVGGILPCASAFTVAKTRGVTPQTVGEEASQADIRIGQCQLGLFGYAPFGTKRMVHPLQAVPDDLAQDLRDAVSDGILPCPAAWSIARRHGLPRIVVGCAAETLEIRIARCQLGCF